MGDKLDKAIDWMKQRSGQCAANTDLEDLKNAVEKAESQTSYALSVGEFYKMDSQIYGKLQAANEKLGKFKSDLEKVQNFCKDIQAIGKFHSAIKILEEDNVIAKDPERAAKAFGQLFVGFSRFCRFIPGLKEYASFFGNMGDFFDNMRYGLDPVLRSSTRRMKNEMERMGDNSYSIR